MARPKKFQLRPEGCLTVTESAKLLGISRATFYRYKAESTDFPPEQIVENLVWYSEADLRAWAASRGVELPVAQDRAKRVADPTE